jgi:MFS family permease
MLVYVFNFVDRQIVNILAEMIKRDLRLSDGEIGLMTGTAFALFYSLLGLPIARLADRSDRPKVIAAAVALWSAFTVLCGFAGSFSTLLLARIGVGTGEAGGVPPSHSLITEFTPRQERAKAIAIYQMGLPLGTLVGFALGGLVADRFGWRAGFFIAGAPGLVFAVIALLVLREPRRRPIEARPTALPPLGATIRTLLGKITYRWMLVGAAAQSIVGYGIAVFVAPFFLRNHLASLTSLGTAAGLGPTGFLGLCLGLVAGLGGAIGTFLGGFAADRLAREKGVRAYAAVPAIGVLICIPAYLAAFLIPNVEIALAMLMIGSAASASWYGPVHGANQGLVSSDMRSTISAVTMMAINLFGLGLGPPLVGFLSDRFHRGAALGEGPALEAALLCSIAISLLTVFAFWRARRTIVADTIG